MLNSICKTKKEKKEISKRIYNTLSRYLLSTTVLVSRPMEQYPPPAPPVLCRNPQGGSQYILIKSWPVAGNTGLGIWQHLG